MSQCSRVLDVLREGGWKSIQEIHQRAGTMRLNSRISDLRLKQGCSIEYRIVDGLHSYRLLDESAVSPVDAGPAGSSSGATAHRAEGGTDGESAALPLLSGPLAARVPAPLEAGHLPEAGPVVEPPSTPGTDPQIPPAQPLRQPTLWETAA